MKQILVTAILCSSLLAATPSPAQVRRHQIGPSITFSNGSSALGIDGKFNLADNVFDVQNSLSLRPFLRWPDGSVDVGAAVTYDFDVARYAQLTPYLGIGLASFNHRNAGNTVAFYGQGGIDIGISPDWSLGASLNVPLNNRLESNATLSANYRF